MPSAAKHRIRRRAYRQPDRRNGPNRSRRSSMILPTTSPKPNRARANQPSALPRQPGRRVVSSWCHSGQCSPRRGAIIVVVDDSPYNRLSSLRDEHHRTPFPARLRGKDVGEIDFVMVDANIDGCVQTLLSRRSLEERHERVLKMRLDHLSIVLPLLTDADEFTYYERLRVMAVLALDWQRERANPA
jgi:hypothetical protein